MSLEENGTNTLYLALGFLRWYETGVSEKERYAPLVLIPIDIIRKSAQKGYVLRIRDEEPQMNITLLEMLRQDFGLTIGGLDPLPLDEKGVDIKRVFNIIRQAVMDKSRWDVEELAFIGLFSFSQFIMWNDIRNRAEDLKKNKIVASLLSGKMEWQPSSELPSPAELDKSFKPLDLAVPISTDSSQLSAICAAGKGNSFVLHGPPGTGKSQTITNIIANALFQGKSVLFIAEKMAALSVVQKRLESIGLGPFCLELHSNKAKKKVVLDQLDKALNYGKIKAPQEYAEQASRLYQLRVNLNEVVEAIHKKRDFGFSLYDAIIRFEQYKDYPDCIKFSKEQVKAINLQGYNLWIDLLNQLKIALVECGGVNDNPLGDFTKSNYSQEIKNNIFDDLKRFEAVVCDLKEKIIKLSELIGITGISSYKQIVSTIKLVDLLLNLDYMPIKLVNSQELQFLKDKVTTVCSNGQKRDQLENQLLSQFSETILNYDEAIVLQKWKEAEISWALPSFLGQNKILKSLKVIAKNPGQIQKEQVILYLNLISEYKANKKVIDDNSSLLSDLFGLVWNGGKADWQVISNYYERAVEINELFSAIVPGNVDDRRLKVNS